MVISRETFSKWLPRSIEAVFYMKVGTCRDSDASMLCENFARRVHNQLKAEFHLDDDRLPLLIFDPWNWAAPFSMAPPG